MRKLWIAAAVVVLLFLAVLAAALVFVRPDDLRPVLESTLERALGRDVSLGKLELSLLPLPAIRIDDVRVAGADEKAPPFAEVDAVRIRLAILPLLVGRIGLASVDVEHPRLSVPLDRRGRPVLPGAAPAGGAPEPGQPKPAGELALAIDRVRLHDASAEVGPYRIEGLDAEGSLTPAGAATADFAFAIPGAGRVRDGRARVENVLAPELALELDLRLEDGDLAGLAKLANLGPGYAGRLDAELSGVRVRALVPEAGRVHARARDLDVRQGEVALAGDAEVSAEVGGKYAIDLSGTEIKSGEATRKPRGLELAMRGKTPAFPLHDVGGELALAGSKIPWSAQPLKPRGWDVTIAPFTLELEPLRPLLGVPLQGRFSADALNVSFPPPLLSGEGRIESLRYPIGSGEATVDGTLLFGVARIVGRPLQIRIGGQTIEANVTYELDDRVTTIIGSGKGLALEELASALAGSKDVSGALTFDGETALPLAAAEPLRGAEGRGHFEIAPGRIRGFSLAKQALGELAALPMLVQSLRGRDMSRYEEEEFQSLSADYTLRDGFAHTDNLRLVYRNAVADLHGKVGLVDGALDLAGKLELSRDVDQELGGRGDRPRVIPISGIGGSVSAPRVKLDKDAIAAAASVYLGSGKVAEQIDQKLGPGAADAVQGVLDILRGQKPAPKREPAPAPRPQASPEERP